MISKSILVIKLGAMGDFIQSLGAMRSIRAHHKNDKIFLLTTSPFEKLAKKSGYVDEIILDKRPKWYEIFQWIKLAKSLNQNHFSRVYDLQNNDRTCLYFKLFRPKPEWVGVARGASHRNTSEERTKGKAFYGLTQTLGPAGIYNVQIDRLDWIKSNETFEGLTKPYVLIVAGGAPQHPYKRWSQSHYKELCEKLISLNILPVLIGTKDDSESTDFIKAAVPGCLNLTGKTELTDLPSLARDAIAAIGNDTGPMHMIGPTGCKTIVLFGNKTDPRRHGPLGENVITLQKSSINDIACEEVVNALDF